MKKSENPADRRIRERIWLTHEGQHLLVEKMETRHIENCILMLNRSLNKTHLEGALSYSDTPVRINTWMSIFLNELTRRQDEKRKNQTSVH